MDHESLRTASTYLNNLLLARGLLREGAPIDFVKPSKESRAQIINLVHDLILREDRHRTTGESAAENLRALRADDQRKTHELERLRGDATTAARGAEAARHAERQARADAARVEKALKTAQDQATKLKAALAQVKTACANDVRKRETELARLKTHLQGQQRGANRGALAAPSLTVRKLGTGKDLAATQRDLGDPEYSLRQETTEFLTQLSQSLSDENDGLIGLIRNAVETMKELLGLPAGEDGRHPDSAIGSLSSEEETTTLGRGTHKGGDLLQTTLPTSYQALSADLEAALSHLKELLTTPNYVSVEEVEVREEEIVRLRSGWDRMEQRWREVLDMMEGWRQRMDVGGTINMEEIRRGIGLVSPVASHRREHSSQQFGELPPEPEQSFMSADVSEIRIDGVTAESSILLATSSSPTVTAPATSKRKRDVLEPPDFFDLRPPPGHSSRTQSTSEPSSAKAAGVSPAPASTLADGVDDDESDDLEVPHMTVAQKLSAAQAEAEEAAAAVISARATSRTSAKPTKSTASRGGTDERDDDTLGQMPSQVVKRTRIKGRPRKRKSTLSPEELEALLATDAES